MSSDSSTPNEQSDREKFLSIFTQYIKREGADKLLAWLEKSDFFAAPASTIYHLSCEGGLCKHSLHVYERLRRLYQGEYGQLTAEQEETVALTALLHDLCKVNFYKPGVRNVKDEHGKWQQVPSYSIEDECPFGHGEKSVYIIQAFMRLTREEAMMVRWHMGGFDEAARGGSRALTQAMEKYPGVALIHTADMLASYLDEVRG